LFEYGESLVLQLVRGSISRVFLLPFPPKTRRKTIKEIHEGEKGKMYNGRKP